LSLKDLTADVTDADRDAVAVSRRSERDELMTADEVAARLRMTKAWVYAETRMDRIPHLRLGRYFRYRRTAIETWLVGLEASRQPRR
jgi:excisionase family DNA binding protein